MKPRIFVSTVSQEFKSARTRVEHVLEFLGYEVEQQDIFGTEAGDLRQMLRNKIDSCEALVQIVGEGYGAEPPNIDPDYGRVSYTQFELLYARLQEKKTWILFAGPGCQRDTPVGDLDLSRDPAHVDPADHQAERRDLQAAYRARLRSEGHLWHNPGDDTALENAILKIRNDSEELRKEFRDWQKTVLGRFDDMEQKLIITAARLRAHLHEASEKALAKDLAEAEAIQGDWEQREKLRQAAQTANEQRFKGIEPLILEFCIIEGSANVTEIAKELIRIAEEQGIQEALRFLESKQNNILTQVEYQQAGIREKLQPLLSGAQLALTAGDDVRAEALFRDVLKADPNWTLARYQFWAFLVDVKGPYYQWYHTVASANSVYTEALGQSLRILEDDPSDMKWRRSVSVSNDRLAELAARQGDLKGAEVFYKRAMSITNILAEEHRDNLELLRDLAVCNQRLGSLDIQKGDLRAALVYFEVFNQIAKRLLCGDPENSEWQCVLASSYANLGEVSKTLGKLQEADFYYSISLQMRFDLAQTEPFKARWLRDLIIVYCRLGEIKVAMGQLEDASIHYLKSIRLSEQLLATDPSNTEWQRDLVVSYNHIGDVFMLRNQHSNAEYYYCKSLITIEDLVRLDHANIQWQRDLHICYSNIGNIRVVAGGLKTADYCFYFSMKIAKQLVQDDPRNSEWQRDLSIAYEKQAKLNLRRGDLQKASDAYDEQNKIAEQLASSDPLNAQWQRDLGVSYNKLGSVALEEGDLAKAYIFFKKQQVVAERLVKSDPANSGLKRDLSVNLCQLGDLHQRQEQWTQALLYFEQCLAIDKFLCIQDPTNITWQNDLEVSQLRVREVLEKKRM